jgi:tetratricopeptide (TPR) repeat protein
MADDSVVETLIGAETLAAAVEYVRRSGIRPLELARGLRAHADQVRSERTAEAAAAAFMADVLAELEDIQTWAGSEQLSAAANSALQAASAASSWVTAIDVLRARRADLDDDVIFSVLHWHTELVRRGVRPETGSLRLVIVLGVVLGGVPLAWTHILWARSHETSSPRHAEQHMLRARSLMQVHGSPEDREVTENALRAFYRRHGAPVPVELNAVPEGSMSPAATLSTNETKAHDLRDEGRYQEALVLLEGTVALAAEMGADPSRMRLLGLRGLIFDDLSEYTLAERDYRAAAELAEKLGDEQRAFEARNNLAASYLKRGEPRRGITAFKDRLARVEETGQYGRRPAALNNLATAFAAADDPRSAIRYYRDALALLEDPFSSSRLIALSGLASAYRDCGQDDEVRAVGAEMLRLWVDGGSEEALRTYLVSSAVELSEPTVAEVAQWVWQAMLARRDVFLVGPLTLKLAAHEASTGDPAGALARLDEFLAVFESERSRLGVCVTAELAAAELEVGDLQRRDDAVRRLRAAVARAEQRLATIDRPPDGDFILDRVGPLYSRLIELLVEGDGLAEAFRLHEAARPMTLTVVATPGRERVVEADDVLRAVANDGRHLGVISLVETASTVGAFVVAGSPPDLAWIPLDLTVDDLTAAAEELSTAFNGDPAAFPPKRPAVASGVGAVSLARTEATLGALGRILPAVGGCDLVGIVPSPHTEGLPLHAVRGPAGERLVERAAVVVAPSLSVLVETATAERRQDRVRKVFVAGVAAAEDVRPEFFERDSEIFDGLGAPVDTVDGAAATPQSVLAGLAGADIAHLACHGFVDRYDVLGSGLLLSDGEVRPSRRRQSVPLLERPAFELTVRSLAEASFETQLLTMRACSTSRRAAVAANEEMSTLNRVFQAAGCRTVVSALWNVDQQSSLAFFRRFYARILVDGLPPCDALRRTQLDLIRESGDHAHLYHWAPFIISGDWTWRHHAC